MPRAILWYQQAVFDLEKALVMTDATGKNFIDLTANIVSAYLSNNPTPAAEIPALISQIHAALVRVSTGRTDAPLEPAKPCLLYTSDAADE